MKQFKSQCLLISLLLLAACSSGKPTKKGTLTSGADGTGGPITNVPTDDINSGDSDNTVLQLVPETGSAMRFLDARGLTLYYQNVFSRKAYGFMHCEKTKPIVAADCTDSIFTKDERVAMGAFDLGSPRMNRAPSNINPPANLTLNYTRTLRSALSRECISLVDAELVKFKASDLAANILIKADKPTATDINEFMKRILGVTGTPIAVSVDAETYATSFAEVVAANKDKNAGMRNGYIGLCIALTMDPLVFIY